MVVMNCENIYTSCSCNCYSHCVDCRQYSILYATSNSVALYDLKERKIVSLFSKHKDVVNSVRWIGNTENYFISSSADKTSIIWKKEINIVKKYQYDILYKLVGHTDSVIISDSVHFKDQNEVVFISASTSNDQILNIWCNEQLNLSQKIDFFIFDLKIYNGLSIPGFLILTAGSNESVNISRYSLLDNNLEFLITLKGHNDWIRSIDLHSTPDGRLMIASGSQDCFIRVHEIQLSATSDISFHKQSFSVAGSKENNAKYTVNLETVLTGHEGWVTSVKWHLAQNELYLLTSSMDKTIVLWEQMGNENDTVWNEKIRFGEVGGNAIGFLGSTSVPSLGLIIGYSFNGAIQSWKQSIDSKSWKFFSSITGHFREVTDLEWEPNGDYFFTCSSDQTTRLHSFWRHNNFTTWHEIARPQVHGYDLKCIAMIGRISFVSGADEKVIRIFNATKNFIDSFENISSSSIDISNKEDQIAKFAQIPALGLSNSAVYTTTSEGDCPISATSFADPPSEEVLLENTLWCESQKLYGHGFEIFEVAVNHGYTLLASACKASNANHASIILWDLKTFKKIANLFSHNLTVTRLRFSPNDLFLLSVSRDRTWTIFDTRPNYSKIANSNKNTGVHTRIIWDCAWTPDSKAFLTASRDKTVVIWLFHKFNTNSSSDFCTTPPLILEQSVTSIDVHKKFTLGNRYLSCLALDSGQFFLYSFTLDGEWIKLYNFESHWHTHTVTRVQFSIKVEPDAKSKMEKIYLATCSYDKSVKLFQIGF